MVGGGSNSGGEEGRGGARGGSKAPNDKRSPKCMPTAYSGKHPTYDSKDPSTATRFFDGVELAAKSASLIGHDEEVVKHALSYLDHQTARKWGLLEGGHEPYNLAKWREEVMKILPKASRYDLGSMSRLEELVREAHKRPIGRDEKAAYFEYSLGFRAEAAPLLETGVIANRDLVVKFIGGLKPSFRETLSEHLARSPATPTAGTVERDEEDPYDLESVIAKATEMVKSAAVGPFGAVARDEEDRVYSRDMTTVTTTDRKDPDGLKDLKVKQESLSEEMAKVFTTLDNVGKSVTRLATQFENFSTTVKTNPIQVPVAATAPQQRYPPAMGTQRPGMYPRPAGATFACWYCGQTTHTISQCPQVRTDIEKGRITSRGGIIYCKGNMIARETPDKLSMKARVDQMWQGPKQAELNLLEEYPEVEDDGYQVFFQDFEEPVVTHSVLQQSLDQMRREQNVFFNRLAQQMRPTQGASPVAPEPAQEPTTRDVLAQLVGMAKRLETMEQNQLQTRRAAAANQEDF